MKTLDLIPRHAPATFDLPGGFTAVVKVEPDEDMSAPWKEHDGHGPVSEWRRLDSKQAGERVLLQDQGASALFYDFAEACKIAKRDGWGVPNSHPAKGGKPGQIAAAAAELDFKRLQDWCNDRWSWIYVWVKVTAPDGTHASGSCGGIESDSDYWREVAAEQIEDCLHQLTEQVQRAAVARCFC